MSVTTFAATDVITDEATLQGSLADEFAEQYAFVWDTDSRTVASAKTSLLGATYSTNEGVGGRVYVTPRTASASGWCNYIYVTVSRAGNVKVAIYDTGANLLGKQLEPYTFAAAGSAYIEIEPVEITASTVYWMAVLTDNNMIRRDGTPSVLSTYKDVTYATYDWESSIGGLANSFYRWAGQGFQDAQPAPGDTDYVNAEISIEDEWPEGAYTEALTSLTPETTIYFRFAAVVGHYWNYGDELSFMPSPAQINPVTDVELTTATLNATLVETAIDWGYGWDTETRDGAALMGSVEWEGSGSVNNFILVKQQADFTGFLSRIKVYSYAAGYIVAGLYADYLAGTCTAGTGAADDDDFDLIDSAGKFLATDVGKTILNTTDDTSTTVKHYVSATEIQVDDDIFVSGEAYKILARGEPGTRLGKRSIPIATTVGYNYVELEVPAEVTAGEYYWLAFDCDTGSSIGRSVATGIGTNRYKTAVFSSFVFPDPAGVGFSSNTYGFSIAGLIPVPPSDSDYTNSYEAGADTYVADDYPHDLTGLTKDQIYYVRFFAEVGGRWYKSEETTFTCLDDVATYLATDILLYQAKLNGEVMSDIGGTVTYRGFVWDTETQANPGDTAPAASTYGNYSVAGPGDYGTGTFYHTPTLTRYTTYFFRACACIGGTWVYGLEQWVHTQSIQLVTGASDMDYSFPGWGSPFRFTSGSRNWAILGYQDQVVGATGSNPNIVVWDYTTQAVVHGPIQVATSPIQTDAHGSCKLIIDANDKLHVFYGAHASAQQWTRSKLALSAADPFPNGDSDDFETPKTAGFDATYCVPGVDSNGDLWLAYRSGSANADLRVSVRKSTNWAGTWADASFGDASHISTDNVGTAWPWVNLPCAPNGDMYFTYCLPGVYNALFAIKWSEGNSRWETVSGAGATLPITSATQLSLLVEEQESIQGRCVGTDSNSYYFCIGYQGLQRYTAGWQETVAANVGVYPQLDMVSDSVIDIYGIQYPYTDPKYILRMRSTDGGATFGAAVKVACLRDVSDTAVGGFTLLEGARPGAFVTEELLDDGTSYYNKKGQMWFQPLDPVTSLAATNVLGTKATLNGRFEILTTATDYGWGYGKVSQSPATGTAPSASDYTGYYEKGTGTYTEGFSQYVQQVTGLSGESTYYARFAVKCYGTWFWALEEVSFLTLEAASTNAIFFGCNF